MKKITAFVLALILTFSLFVPAASAAGEKTYPVIYIQGYGAPIVSEKGNTKSDVYYPTGADVGAIVREALGPCLAELAMGVASGDYDKYCDELYNAIAPIYENLLLNPDGTAKGNSGAMYLPSTGLSEYDRFSGGKAAFAYDWRLSPETVAVDLAAHIDKILAKTGAKKVDIIGRCLGGNILSAYLQNFSEDAKKKIDDAILFIPSTEGINMIGALFAGQLEINARNLDEFADEILKYHEFIEDPAIKDFVTVLISIFEQAEILDVSVESLQYFLDAIKDNLIPRLVRGSYGSFPSFWSMVPEEYLEDAIEFVYNTPELQEEYAGTIELARSYNDNVKVNARNCVAELSETIDISIISKYNIPAIPIFPDCNNTTDGTAETYLTSFGATTADYSKTLSEEYIASMSEEDLKYLSADEKIDASTCVLPDKTWFIKNSYHDHFPESIDRLMERIFTTEDMTVFSDEEFPQFLDADVTGEELTPVTEKDFEKPDYSTEMGKYYLLFEFIIAVIPIVIKLINLIYTSLA